MALQKQTRAVCLSGASNGHRDLSYGNIWIRDVISGDVISQRGVIMAKATFAAGCFWGVEDAFRGVEGVTSTTVGYTGGTAKNPTYKEVCTGRTGHAEAVEIEFDPAKISYLELLAIFWKSHDPTTPNRQGPDVGTQYRSAIFFHDPEQEAEARASKAELEKNGVFKRPIVTEITPASAFYRAEDYHQQYFEKQGIKSCHI
jgi:peptide-methionine (S)-S-oxide reductase